MDFRGKTDVRSKIILYEFCAGFERFQVTKSLKRCFSEFINLLRKICFSLVKIQGKLSKAAACLEYFTMQEWEFDDANVSALSLSLSEADRAEFCFDVAKINWENYLENYILGIRRWVRFFRSQSDVYLWACLQVYLQRRRRINPESPQTNLQAVHRLSAAAGGGRDDHLALFSPQVFSRFWKPRYSYMMKWTLWKTKEGYSTQPEIHPRLCLL